MRLESLYFFAEAILKILYFFLQRFYFVFIMSVVGGTSVTDPAALMLTARIYASLLSQLVGQIFHFTTQHSYFVLSRRLPILRCRRIDKRVLNEIYHRGLINLMFLQRSLSSASPYSILCMRQNFVGHSILILVISIERNE